MRVSRGLCEEFAPVLDRGSVADKSEFTASGCLGDPRRPKAVFRLSCGYPRPEGEVFGLAGGSTVR